jgi:hypothetical protein
MRTSTLLALLWPTLLFADWRDDAGYARLQAELGGSMPTGAGILVLMSEANYVSPPSLSYLPQATAGSVAYAGTGTFAGKTLFPASGPAGYSPHAAGVANFYFGPASVSPGVTDAACWLADDFVSLVYDPTPVFGASVMNHSWVGSTANDAIDIELSRKLDFLLERDNVFSTAPLNNGSGQSKLLVNTFHTLSVGLRSGNHPQTHTNLDGVGRMKPDLVVDQPVTSYAGPSVASAAAVLLDVIRPTYPTADDPRVVKALLITAASKDRLPAWHRVNTTRPYDEVSGAGELNLYDAYHTLVANQQTASISTERSSTGWDKGTAMSATPQRYFFSIPSGQWASRFTTSITWHRQFSSGVSTATLANINLSLRHATALVPGTLIDQSTSSADNIEHLFQRHLPAGQYVLEVSSDTDSIVYGIAWRSITGGPPTLAVQRNAGISTLSMSDLDPYRLYTLEGSSNLTSWTTVTTFRTADTTPSFSATRTESTGATQRFYRLRWP